VLVTRLMVGSARKQAARGTPRHFCHPMETLSFTHNGQLHQRQL
jgi:hypothetical protein